MGVPPSELHRLRVATCRSLGRFPRGATVGLRLYTFKNGFRVDPWVISTGLVLHQWASAVWEGDPKPSILTKTLDAARTRCQASTRPWTGAATPADVFYLTLQGIGWEPTSSQVIRTDQGQELNLVRLAPALLKRLVETGVSGASDRRALEAHSSPWKLPIFWACSSQLFSKKTSIWTVRHHRALRAVFSGVWWSQARLHKRGLAASGACALCGDPD
eukprot:1722580-Pyramimonas_sp.AAC.1